MMKIITISAFMILTLSSLTFAKSYAWKDYTKPFEEMIGVGENYGSSDVKVLLPESVIKKYEEMSLLIHTVDLDADDGAFLQINNSWWSSYNLYNTDGNIHLKIKTKYFEKGINTLIFSYKKTQDGTSDNRKPKPSYRIGKMYFDIPETQSADTIATVSSKTQPAEVIQPPLKLVIFQKDKIRTKDSRILISGKVTGGKGKISLTVDGKPVRIQKNGGFQTYVPVISGKHALRIQTQDQSGMTEKRILTVIGEEEKIPLKLVIDQGDEIRCSAVGNISRTRGIIRKASCNRISGQVTGGKGRISLFIDGSKIELQEDGKFQTEISVEPGERPIKLRAEDQTGLKEERVLTVIGEE